MTPRQVWEYYHKLWHSQRGKSDPRGPCDKFQHWNSWVLAQGATDPQLRYDKLFASAVSLIIDAYETQDDRYDDHVRSSFELAELAIKKVQGLDKSECTKLLSALRSSVFPAALQAARPQVKALA
jgi:hypothetical protein